MTARFVAKALVLLIACVASTAAAKPRINSHLPKEEIRKITAVIHIATREPILSIEPTCVDKPVLGAISAGHSTEFFAGSRREVPNYERTDRAVVLTGSDAHVTGVSYVVRKVGAEWVTKEKSFWIQ